MVVIDRAASSTDLILAGRDEEATKILRWLRDDPSVLSIQAEAPDEAIAFLYAAIGELPEPDRTAHYARSLIANDVEVARKLGDSLSPLIIVLEDAEPGLAQRLASRGHHVFIALGPSVGTGQLSSCHGRRGMRLNMPWSAWDLIGKPTPALLRATQRGALRC